MQTVIRCKLFYHPPTGSSHTNPPPDVIFYSRQISAALEGGGGLADVEKNSLGFDYCPLRSSHCGKSPPRGRAGTIFQSSASS